MDRQIEKKIWTRKRIILLSSIGVFAFFILRFIVFGDRSSKYNVQAERITISTVEEAPFQEFIPVTGTVIPIQTVYLDAVEGGQVEQIHLEAGSFVEEDDIILTLVNARQSLELQGHETDLVREQNNLRSQYIEIERNRAQHQSQLLDLDYQINIKKRLYDRYSDLYPKGGISLKEYEDARDDYEYYVKKRELTVQNYKQDSLLQNIEIENSLASIQQLERSLELAQLNARNLIVRAPVSGQLTSLTPETGESITSGERIGQIDVLDGFKVRVNVDEHYITRIQNGQVGEATYSGQTYRLVISKIYPEVVVGLFEVDMEFEGEAPGAIRRGQTLQIRLQLGDLSEAILLARGGFYQKTVGQWVYVLDPSESYAVKRPIRLGRQNPQFYEVLEGLEPGDRVITSSYDTYGDIDKLILKD
ncbi:HlyD family efflux transporter periplasmic adaptor subunit [bacterium]|nr:HlyD family efflux transporter periplasmic adaptor subunit [bacterium]RQV94744.1 MAG: HlyD family efflux transporter periplasmic adaptor subunit [bacterium]